MTRFFSFLLLFISISDSCLAGITVVGTRFFIDEKTRSLNIKVINDHESDYLIKTTLDSNDFIISPPLFVLPKDRSNIITIIPTGKIISSKDMVYSLTISAIPRSTMTENINIVSLAIRSHFKLVYQHKLPSDNDFNLIKLVRLNLDGWYLTNSSNFALMIDISNDMFSNTGSSQLLVPGQKFPVNNYCDKYTCSLWLNIINSENGIVKKINLTSH